ncbi:MAG: IPT/TIG domain-containing protein, partial [Candidatus Omnitrophota bacterium]
VIKNISSREISLPFSFAARLGGWWNTFDVAPDSTIESFSPGREITYDVGYLPLAPGDNSLEIFSAAADHTANVSHEASRYLFTCHPHIESPMADITVSDIALKQSSDIEGGPISVEVTITNRGDGLPECKDESVSGHFVRTILEYRFPGGARWFEAGVSEDDLRTITPGGSTVLTIRSGPLAGGDYEFRVIADQWAALRDRDRSNNMIMKMLSVRRSPLEILRFSPARQGRGGSVNIRVKGLPAFGGASGRFPITVRFGDAPAVVAACVPAGDREHEITVIVPDDARTGRITIEGNMTHVQTKSEIEIFGVPAVLSLTPDAACIGEEIAIAGTHFIASADDGGASIVHFTAAGGGAKEVHPDRVEESRIVVTIPEGVVTGPVSVKTGIGGRFFLSGAGPNLTVLPRIDVVRPAIASPGERFAIRGAGFVPGTLVYCGDVPAPIISCESKTIICILPQISGECIVKVVNPDGHTCAASVSALAAEPGPGPERS